MCKVSVIIPCYNASSYIGECVKSVLNQTYPNVECIVVDDGSTDSSWEIINGFDDARIKKYRQNNHGAASARNKGLHYAEGDYIQFLDADDMLHPDKIARQMGLLEKNCFPTNVIISGSWSRLVNNSPVEVSMNQKSVWHDYENPCQLLVDFVINQAIFPPSAYLTPKTLIDSVGGGMKSCQEMMMESFLPVC